MKRLCSWFAVIALFASSRAAFAEETNSYPKSNLENLEETTGLILIRSTDETGSVAGKSGGVAVQCREIRDAASNQRLFGALVTVMAGDNANDTTVVDYDELEGLIRAIDYVGKVDWSITSLSHFEASFTTRSGLKVATYSSRRSGTIEAFALSNRQTRCRSNLTTAQFAQMRVLLEQAKAKIDILMREK